MGKLTLLIVFALAVAGGSALLTAQDADVRASARLGDYEADVVAREISQSAYNAGAADLAAHGNDVAAALAAFGEAATDCGSGRPACRRRTGSVLGGTYVVEAAARGGNAVDVRAVGTFTHGGAPVVHVIEESVTFDVLGVDPGLPAGQCGEVRVQFLESRATHCSAVFLQETHGGVTGRTRMVYPPGKHRDGERNDGFAVLVAPGTRINVGIGVDDACRSGGSRPTSHPSLRMDAAEATRRDRGPAALAADMDRYVYRAGDWARTLWALDAPSAQFAGAEGPSALVEADPARPQRWRVAFEDRDGWDLAPSDARYLEPRRSLWATKAQGYDRDGDGRGEGWADRETVTIGTSRGRPYVARRAGPDGFHDLTDSGNKPDFSDQVVFVEVVPTAGACPSVSDRGRAGGGPGPAGDHYTGPTDGPGTVDGGDRTAPPKDGGRGPDERQTIGYDPAADGGDGPRSGGTVEGGGGASGGDDADDRTARRDGARRTDPSGGDGGDDDGAGAEPWWRP